MNRKYLVAAALLMLVGPSVSAQSVKAGIEAWQRSDYGGAVSIWRPLAEKGDADAEFNLGQAYRLGRGVPTNLAAAKTWFERAAGQGHVDAETTLGLLLFQNGDVSEGLKWLKKAADQGEPRALLVYGTALVNGDSITQDPALGYAYVSRAAEQGLQPARDTLAELDRILPAAYRKRGSEMAQQLAKDSAPPKAAPEREVAKPVQTATTNLSKPRVPEAKPKPKVAKAAPAPAAAVPERPRLSQTNAAWRIQLGAFSQKSNAETLYKKLSPRGALAGRKPFYVASGSVTRLQIGPFDTKTSAEAACKSLGVPCFAVAAK